MTAVAPAPTDPNKTFGIVALVVSIVASLIGGILGIVALSKSRKAGYKNGFALAAIIVGFSLFVIQVIGGILIAVAVIAGVSAVCDGHSGETLTTGDSSSSSTITCP